MNARNVVIAGLAVALLGALATAGIERTRVAQAKAQTAAARAEFADYRATQAEAGRHAEKAERQKERDREDDIRSAVAAARAGTETDGAAAVRATSAGRELRDALHTTIAQLRASASTAAAGGGPTADATADLLDRVQRRLDEASEGVAGFADASRGAGLTCERIHDALSRTPR